MIDFWFSIGSTYTYLSVMRLAEVERTAGVACRWRPFSVCQIMIEMDNIPFRTKPVKMAYMWRDVERRARLYGLRIRVPAPYPLSQWDVASRCWALRKAGSPITRGQRSAGGFRTVSNLGSRPI
jgi:2-hydroxychromene-2-carboxylate isomerase